MPASDRKKLGDVGDFLEEFGRYRGAPIQPRML
jgi:hypothetical protein